MLTNENIDIDVLFLHLNLQILASRWRKNSCHGLENVGLSSKWGNII